MRINKFERNGNLVTLEIEEAWENIVRAKEEIVSQTNKEAKLPGFRPGKTPQPILEKRVGKEYFHQKTLDKVLNKAYFQAISENNLEPVDYPTDLQIIQNEEGSPLKFSLKIEVRPEIKLRPEIYKGVKFAAKKQKVTDEQVNRVLNSIQDNFTTYDSVSDRGIELHDLVRIDLRSTVDGQVVPEWNQPDAGLRIGDSLILKEFDDQLVSLKIGEEKKFSLEFSGQYPLPFVAGKKADFFVKVKEIRAPKKPELNDELAKKAGPFETLEALKKQIRDDLEKRAEDEGRFAVGQEVIKKIATELSLEIPEAMIQRRMDFYKNQLERDLSQSGLGLADYLKYLKKPEEEYFADLKNRSREEIKSDLILDEVAKIEKITPLQEEIAREIFNLAGNLNQDPIQFNQTLDQNTLNNIRNYLVLKKSIDFLVDNAAVTWE